MALEFTPPHQVVHRPKSARELLLKAISLPNVPLPEVDSRGSVALKPRYPMNGPAAEPAPEVEISFPQAEAGHEIAKSATLFKGINLAETIRLTSIKAAKARAEKLAEPPPEHHEESHEESNDMEPVPTVPHPVMSAGPLTQAMDRSRVRRWGR